MLGAIIGDVVGSVYEGSKRPPSDFDLFVESSRFTDDTTLTMAIAEAVMEGADYADKLKDYYFYYPNAGYGSSFHEWARSSSKKPYNSYGNGSAMRVSPVVWVAEDGMEVLKMAKQTAEVTHNHPEGIKGAQAIAALAFLAKGGESKESLAECAEDEFGYNFKMEKAKPCQLECTCQTTVPKAIYAFYHSKDFEDSIRIAVGMGGDADTIAAMTGTISEHFYGIPNEMKKSVFPYLDERIGNGVVKFYQKYVDKDFDPEVEIKNPEGRDISKESLESILSSVFSV